MKPSEIFVVTVAPVARDIVSTTTCVTCGRVVASLDYWSPTERTRLHVAMTGPPSPTVDDALKGLLQVTMTGFESIASADKPVEPNDMMELEGGKVNRALLKVEKNAVVRSAY